ncbi:MAG: single-stranded-DNA-specific exonuclease RecJ [Rickettsiaceae bacterium]|nr:single-stranded-DNA-specific exonuclease RecJ [Rickettsiaceae bacterium]
MLNRSAMGKFWQQKAMDERRILTIMQKYSLDQFLATLVAHRDLELKDIEDFLNPKIKNTLPNPLHLIDIEKALQRTIKAIDDGELICIFADYDVDGATSSALLKNIMRQLGNDAIVYIPDRIKEGYGPSAKAVKKLKDIGVSLMITLDCGSQSFDACAKAKELGLDVIVIDHHITGSKLPDVFALVNPNRLDETSDYGHLAAVGVTFLFVVALLSKLKAQNYTKAHQINLLEYLDLVALGTICDVVALKNVNRAFVSQGLKIIQNTQNIGLRSLIKIASISEPISCYHLGFVLGPRINAGGRVGKADTGSKLLTTTNQEEADYLAERLQQYNQIRQQIENENYLEALNSYKAKSNENFVLVHGNWHPGVVGLIAGKMKELHNIPSFAITTMDKNIAKGSCRSIANVDIAGIILKAKSSNILEEGGGHAMAAGFSLKSENIENFSAFLQHELKNKIPDKTNVIYYYDLSITGNSLNEDFLSKISSLAPFGAHNHEPIFLIDKLYLFSTKLVAEKHISCNFTQNSNNGIGNKMLSAVAFNAAYNTMGQILLSQNQAKELSIIATIKNEFWKGQSRPKIIIQDIII